IVDIRMPVMNGIETVKELSSFSPATRALVLSMHDDEEYITQSIEVGAGGYLLKDSSQSEFIKAIHTVYNGEKYFAGDISNILVNSYLNLKKGISGGSQVSSGASEKQLYNLTKRERQILHMLYTG